MEEAMIYLPQRIPLLVLSATVGTRTRSPNGWGHPRQGLSGRRGDPPPRAAFPPGTGAGGTLLPLLVGGAGQKVRLYKKVAELLGGRKAHSVAPPGRLPLFAKFWTFCAVLICCRPSFFEIQGGLSSGTAVVA